MKATAIMGDDMVGGGDGTDGVGADGGNGVKTSKMPKGKLKQAKTTSKAVNALALPPSASSSDYSKDPDKGERPYHEHEVKDMAHHVVNAMAIIHHPHKSKAVQDHFSSQKMHAKTFDQLKTHIAGQMD